MNRSLFGCTICIFHTGGIYFVIWLRDMFHFSLITTVTYIYIYLIWCMIALFFIFSILIVGFVSVVGSLSCACALSLVLFPNAFFLKTWRRALFIRSSVCLVVACLWNATVIFGWLIGIQMSVGRWYVGKFHKMIARSVECLKIRHNHATALQHYAYAYYWV